MWEVKEVKYNECHSNKVVSGKGLVGKTASDLYYSKKMPWNSCTIVESSKLCKV